jgi:SAM-dependent methyltransferase
MRDIHNAAQQAYTQQAQSYGRGRPEYPVQLREWLRDVLDLAPGRTVADIGAGTGKFCKLLVETGAEAIAVEPIDEMRAQAAQLPGVKAVAGTAQDLPLPSDSLDAIVCAQAFHWFASRKVLDEFARVLRAGGHLGLVWNVRDESVDWNARITQLITPLEGDAPRFYKGDWRRPFPHPAFSALEETSFPYEHAGPPSQVIMDRFMSVSFVASQPQETREHVRGALEQLIATHPDLRGRETVSLPYRTLAFHCVRR